YPKKYDPDRDEDDPVCIELESLSQETGVLLETFNAKNLKSIKNRFDKGDVLFGKLRPYLRKFLLAPFSGVCSSEIWVLKGKVITNHYLFFLIQGERFIRHANMSSGSKMPRADWDYLSSVVFRHPTKKDEQKKIADFLTAVDQ